MDLEEQYEKIYRYCYFKVNQREIAEDITQETFLRFHESSDYVNTGKAMQYLYTIARNLCIEEYRKGHKEKVCEINEELSHDPTEEWIDSIAMKNLISKLPQDEQELLLLRYANDVSIASICKITGLSRFAIYRKTSRILKYLKTELQEGGFSDE